MRTLKVLGFLLAYPEQRDQKILEECAMILHEEKWISPKVLGALDALISQLMNTELLELQESYVNLFDRTPSLSLHLFEHVHGDSRERGQAMVDLVNVYQEADLVINSAETPDYLPLFLEYLSSLPAGDVKDNMGSIVNILSSVALRLKNRESGYAAVFDALVETASRKPNIIAVEKAIHQCSGEPYDFEQIDKEWEEQFAFDSKVQSDGCPTVGDRVTRSGYAPTAQRIEK